MTSLSPTNTEADSTPLNPVLILILALIVAPTAPIFMKAAQNAGLPSLIIVTGRMVLAAIILTPLVIRNYSDDLRKLSRRDLVFALFAGSMLAAHFVTLIFSLERTSIMLLTVLLNTQPLWTALLERTFLKTYINRIVWIGLFITILGGSFIAVMNTTSLSEVSNTSLLGIILGLAASMLSAGYLTVGRSVRKKVSMIPYVWIVFGFGGIVGTAILLITGTPILGHAGEGYFWVLMLTLIPQLIGHSGFNYVVRYFSATFLSIAGQTLTIAATILAFFVFSEVPTRFDILGSIIILSGVMLAIYGRRQKTSTT